MAAPPPDERASGMHAQGMFELASAAEGKVRQLLLIVILVLRHGWFRDIAVSSFVFRRQAAVCGDAVLGGGVCSIS